jgi:hypothetical protein
MKQLLLLMVLLLLVSNAAYGQLYEWIDDRGSVNFTDNPDRIPAKYRNSATVREGDMKGQGEKSVKPAVQPQPPQSKPELYDGKVLSWWQKEYKARLKQLELEKGELERLKDEQNTARRKRITMGRASDRMALAEKRSEAEAKEARVKDLEKELTAFKSSAERSGLTTDMLETGGR